ncbi:MAG TPA: hypothetical protein ENK54_09815 [Thiotrichales bacterium]|nr:hypothetical protein [Thiotrichales bacterium]
MTRPLLLSVVESAMHPSFADLYGRLGLREERAYSIREAMRLAKRLRPAWIVAEFFYGYGNNYSGVHVSNLDVLLVQLQTSSPQTRVVVLVQKEEMRFVERLTDRFPVHAVMQLPADPEEMQVVLTTA